MKNEKSGLPEDLATIMMMIRQHNNTVKYEVDNNMQKVRKLKTLKSKGVKTPNELTEIIQIILDLETIIQWTFLIIYLQY